MSRAAIGEHCAHLNRLNRRKGTIAQRRWALLRLMRSLGGDDIVDAELHDLRVFLDRAKKDGEPLSAEARAAETGHLIGFYRWAVREGWRVDDPTVHLERPKRAEGLPRPMPDQHVTRALTAAPEPMRTWFYLAAYGGLRACEVAMLRGEDLQGETLRIRDGKGGRPGIVPVAPILRAAVAHLPRRGVWFPHGHDETRSITASQLDRRANRWLHDHDIAETFHQLRHWYGTKLYQATRDLRVVQDLMRHASVATTQRYTELSPDAGAQAVAMLPNLR